MHHRTRLFSCPLDECGWRGDDSHRRNWIWTCCVIQRRRCPRRRILIYRRLNSPFSRSFLRISNESFRTRFRINDNSIQRFGSEGSNGGCVGNKKKKKKKRHRTFLLRKSRLFVQTRCARVLTTLKRDTGEMNLMELMRTVKREREREI